ncbi:MAG: TrmH family RNA methyltransferase [Bdellovibrionales bacterium]
MSVFPFSPDLDIATGLKAHFSLVNRCVGPLLTPERREKIERVVAGRNFGNAVVLEGIYDRGNVSAVMRTAEALGFVNFHVIETQEKFKEANRVTQGADKWTEVIKWKKTRDAVTYLKSKGHRIVVTSLEAAKPISEIDWTTPTALVLGNEKDGISQEMLELSDERIIIPMNGFVQSFNISVAGALSLYHIYLDRTQKLGRCADVTDEQKEILKALYAMRTQESAEQVLRRVLTQQT